MAEDRPLFVARDEDVHVLRGLWEEAKAGNPRVVRLQAPFGGGRRAVAGEFLRGVATGGEDAIVWRVTCLDQENGLNWLVRMYGSLVATLTSDVLRKGRIELLLNAALPAQPKRVQGWYQEFVGSLKEAKTDREKGAVQLRIPKDNPLIGLVEVVSAISKKVPVVLELQNPFVCYSLALPQFVEALYAEAKESGGKVMVLLHDEPADDVAKSLHPMPLLDLYERRKDEISVHVLEPWGTDETRRFLESKGVEGDAARIAEIAKGRPGFIAELVEILGEKGLLGGDLSSVSLASLVPMEVDEASIEVPSAPPAEGERKHATKDDLGQVAFFGALLGQAFPSNLVADMGGFDRDSIDDLVDAAEDLFEEVQFAEELQTWIYKFKRGSWREGILEQNDSEQGHDLARRVGLFMERFLVPRGYAFIPRTARVYAEHGAPARANVMRSLALSNDAPDVWGLAYDLMRYFDEVTWPDAMKRTVYMNLLDRMVAAGAPETAEQIHRDATEWAQGKEDRELTAWLLFSGSRLDSRRQDFYRARDRARDALKLYTGLGNTGKQAEIHNHLAGIEVQDGNPNAALEHVEQALQLGVVEQEGKKLHLPGVLANAEFIKGLVARRTGKAGEAAEHFRKANEVAGQTGMAGLALDAGLSYGEALLASSQTEKARDVLERVVGIARQLRNPVQERGASALLAQAQGAMKDFQNALQNANRVLELTKGLRLDNLLPVDLYNVGFFHFATNKPTEALTFFRQSQERLAAVGGDHPLVKELWYFTGMAHLQTGSLEEAKAALRNGLRPAQQMKDWRRMVGALDALATIEERQGNAPVAKKLIADAIGFAEKGNLKEERKQLRRRLEAIG